MKYIVVALALALANCERRTCVRTKEQEVWIWLDQYQREQVVWIWLDQYQREQVVWIWLDQYQLVPIKQTVCTQWARVHE